MILPNHITHAFSPQNLSAKNLRTKLQIFFQIKPLNPKLLLKSKVVEILLAAVLEHSLR